MLVKKKVLESINKFPDIFSIDDLIEKLIIIDKVEKANIQSLNNDIVSESELDIEVEKWFK